MHAKDNHMVSTTLGCNSGPAGAAFDRKEATRPLCGLMAAAVLILVSLVAAPAARATTGTMVITTNTTLTEDHYGNIVIATPGVTLDGNGFTVHGPGEPGFSGLIEVTGAIGAYIFNTTVTGSQATGLYVHEGAWGVVLENNRFVANESHGIYTGANSTVLLNNTIQDNGASGFYANEYAWGPYIEGNTFVGNANHGVDIRAGVDWFAGNTSRANGANGFNATSGQSHWVAGNAADENTGAGFVFIGDSGETVATYNTATGNEVGFVMKGSGRLLSGNTATENDWAGFVLDGCNGCGLTANAAIRNGDFGILVMGGSSGSYIGENAAYSNGYLDIWDDGSGTGNTWYGHLDPDADGLIDGAEGWLGTDPTDPDTDDDGMLDGAEVDTAAGGGCPDPLVADSDADGLLDGTEVALDTNPCNADSDADGVGDATDPLPTEPGVTSGWLEDFVRDAATEEIPSIDLSAFDAPTVGAAAGRRNALANRATDAANAIAAGNYETAIDKLTSLLSRIDGDPTPPDWLADSPEQDALLAEVTLLIELVELLAP